VNAVPNEIEHIQSQITEVERSLRLIEERKNQFIDPKAIPLDTIAAEREQQDRLEELRKRLEAISSATTQAQSTLRISTHADIRGIYVNRDEEQRLFRQMISGQTRIHILLMEAEGGMGKTGLLNQFWEISEGFKRARVDFDVSSYTVGKILGELRDQYGQQCFPIFHTECRNLLSQLGHDVAHNALICAAIDLRLAKMSGDELRDHQRLITNAFLADLEAIHEEDQPIVMLFDTFEKSMASTNAWVTEMLIDEIRRYPWLVCVIAGRKTPRIPSNDMSWCLQHTLQPLSVQHCIEYIQKVKITQNEELVTFITKFSKGKILILQQLVLSYLEG
jgi:hypothetical protein